MKTIILIIGLLFLNSGCSAYYPDMTGTVVDAETGKPIEGAIVLVEWTKRVGIGDYHTESVKVVEALSDAKGMFHVSGIFNLSVDPPDVTVYKKGYVAWSSRSIFPSLERRTDFKWGDYVFRLEKFRETYSYTDHQMFTSRAINDTIGWENKKLFIKSYEAAERAMIIREQNDKDRKRAGRQEQ